MKSLFLIAATACCPLTLTASEMTRVDGLQSPVALAGPLVQAAEKSVAPVKAASAVAFSRMSIDQVQARLLQWLAQAKTDEATATKVTALWADKAAVQALPAEDVLDLLMESFAIADESVQALMEACRTSGVHEPMNFEGVRSDSFFREQVQLYHARWFTQHRFFDEAMVLLESLNPETSVDPASLLSRCLSAETLEACGGWRRSGAAVEQHSGCSRSISHSGGIDEGRVRRDCRRLATGGSADVRRATST